MKNLKIFSIVVLFFAMVLPSFAQTFGVKAGLNLANMLMKDNDINYSDELNFKMNPGFHVGATIDFPISELISFEPAVLLATKGFKFDEKETYLEETYKYTMKLNLYYLDIPLNFKILADVGGAKIYGAAGPYVGIGLSGKSKTEEIDSGEKYTEEMTVEWGNDEEKDDFKRLDYGVGFGAGVEIKSVSVGVSYALGLANISTFTDNGTKISNRVLGVSLGYQFGGN